MVSASLMIMFATTGALGANSNGETVLLEFSAPWCGPCQQVKPVVAKLAAAGYPIRQINLDKNRQLAARYGVTNIPCFVAISNGKVVQKVTGYHSYSQLQQLMSRSGITKPAERIVSARAQSPDINNTQRRTMANTFQGNLQTNRNLANIRTANNETLQPVNNLANQKNVNLQGTNKTVLKQKILNATVRLKVEDPKGFSYGTGTIIDTHGNEALILTCGHLFSDHKGKGKITIDTFGIGAQQGLTAKLLSYDLKRDIGFVTVSASQPFSGVSIAAKNSATRKGDQVLHIGCDNGKDPTIGTSVITGINTYLGPENLTVAGMPVEGRSGGGLFNSQGKLIGVCNAADPADNEGLFAALAPIRKELDRSNLAFIYKKADQTQHSKNTLSKTSTEIPKITQIGRTVSNQIQSSDDLTNPALSSQQRAALALASNKNHAEVICIIRSLKDPRAKSEVFVLDRASPEFLNQLRREKNTQAGRFQTTHTTRCKTENSVQKTLKNRVHRSSAGWSHSSE